LTDNFCAVREDAVDLATGAKAVQLVADVARMQRRALAIDDFMIIAAVYCSIMVAVCPAAAALVFFVSVVLVPKKQHRQSRTNQDGRALILVGNAIKRDQVRHHRTALGQI